MTSLFPRCPLLIAHCVGLRLIALAQAKADPRLAVWAFVVVLFGMLTACAGLPSGVQRPNSQARIDVADTRLAAVAAASMPAGNGQLSGMRLLPAGDQAFEARIALVRAAEKSIDAQYYQIADDLSGRQFLRGLADAAARGVRVRLLVDDLHAAGQDALLAGLAARPNLEVRMFNPLAVRDGGVASRVLFSLHEFSRVNRRMHNKLLVADNVFAITGGRNIANAYFGRSEPANFIDMDMFAAGPVVRELSAVFDGYWNSEHAYPIQSLAAAEFSSEAARRQFDDTVRAAGAAELTVAARDPLGQSSVGSQLANGRLELHIAAARVIADAPAKAALGDASLAYGAVMNGKLELMQSARSEVLVASPYFVPGRRTLEILKQATDNRGARVGHHQLAGHDGRAAGALRLRALPRCLAADGRLSVRADARRRDAGRRRRRTARLARPPACQGGGGGPALALHRLAEHGPPLGPLQHRDGVDRRQPGAGRAGGKPAAGRTAAPELPGSQHRRPAGTPVGRARRTGQGRVRRRAELELGPAAALVGGVHVRGRGTPLKTGGALRAPLCSQFSP
jgi:hypothetical protein